MKKPSKLLLVILSVSFILLATIFVIEKYNINFASVDMGESEMLRTDLVTGGKSYFSSDESVATVDSNGCVTGHKNGIVFITVKSDTTENLQETFICRVKSDFDEQQEVSFKNIVNVLFVFFVAVLAIFGTLKIFSAVNSMVKATNTSRAVAA